MGLLSKANLLDKPSEGLAFSNLIKNNNLPFFVLFQKNNNGYSIVNSFGLDAATITHSNSTVDFWNGICPSVNTIYNFTKIQNTLGPLLQFFSSDLIEKLNNISLIRLSNDNIYMICNSQITDEIKNQLSLVDINKYSNELSSLENNSNDFIKLSLDYSNLQNKYTDFTNSVSNEIYNRLLCSYFKDIYITKTDSTIDFALNQKECNNTNVLIKHVKTNLTEVLEDNINLITIKAE